MPPRWIDPRDFIAVGEAETVVEIGGKRLLGMHVTKTAGGTLGMLAVKVVGDPERELPISIAIADERLELDLPTNTQSNPRRRLDKDDDGA